MPEMPVSVNGVTRLVWVESLDEDNWRAAQHQYRREGAMMRRQYHDGTQYDAENLLKLQEEFPGCSEAELLWKRLPEHQRKHAYSTQIKDGISFLADEIAEALMLKAKDPATQAWLLSFQELSKLQHRWEEVIQDTLITGDVAAKLIPRSSALDGEAAVRVEFWRSEDIEIDYADDDWQLMEEVRYEEYRNEEGPDGETREIRYVHVFRLRVFQYPDGEFREEAVEEVFRDDEETPSTTRRLGLPFLPWVHLTGEKAELRSMYGSSVITAAVMTAADRYNATCQLQYLVLRYNSFATLAVVGDSAHLSAQEGKMIRKDIADVLTFPGGTGVQGIELPTDVQLFEVHKHTLVASMYEALGLNEIDSDTIEGIGGISGYALEILNRKNNGTFGRIKQNVREGIEQLIEKALDMDAIVREADVDAEGNRMFWTVDPDTVWPNRDLIVAFGSSYIVDDAKVEREYALTMISRREALRQGGYSEDHIVQIEKELEEENAQAADRIAAQITTGNGSRLATSSVPSA